MLHFVYLVERFLLNLIRRRCFFSLVFFNGKFHHKTLFNVDFTNVSTLSESVETMLARTLARKLVIEHIGKTLSDKMELHIFPTIDCAEFQKYVAKTLVCSPIPSD